MSATHVVTPHVASKADYDKISKEVLRRWLRVRRISTMRKLDAIGLSWVYEYDADDDAIYASKELESCAQHAVEKVFDEIFINGLDDVVVARSGIFPKKAFLSFITSRTETDQRVMRMIDRRAGLCCTKELLSGLPFSPDGFIPRPL